MELTSKQLEAVEASGSVAVTAGAGTGKTAMLAARYVHHIVRDKFSPLEIVAVTFTEKAASELRSRIREKALAEVGEKVAAQVDAAQISTIHSLAARICRDFYDVAGVPADFRMLDETDAEILIADWFDDALPKLGPDLVSKLGYTWIREALRTLLTDPTAAEEALWYTDEQYYELIDRSNQEDLAALQGSECWREAEDILNRFNGNASDKLEPYRDMVVRAMGDINKGENISNAVANILSVKLNVGSQANWPDDSLTRVKECIKALRSNLADGGDFANVALTFGEIEKEMYERVCLLRHAFLYVRQFVQNAKRERRLLDFDDLEHYALNVLESDHAQKHYAKRWRAILVDEFQDTNPVQEKILKALSKHARLTIVGDGKQSIYGFRRADPRVFKRFREWIKNDVVLNKTFRTHGGLVEPMNTVFSSLLADSHEPLLAERIEEPHEGPFIEVSSFFEDGQDIDSMRRVEAKYIACEIRRLIESGLPVWDKTVGLRPVMPRDIAILSRTRAPLDLYIDQLLKAGVPAVNTGGGDLLETRTVKDLIALLRFVSDPTDDIALVSLLRGPFFAVSDKTLQVLSADKDKDESWWHLLNRSSVEGRAVSCLQKLIAFSRSVTAVEFVRIADEMTGYTAVISNMEQGKRRMADWFGFLSLLQKFASLGRSDVVGAQRYFSHIMRAETVIARPPIEAGDAVSLMTIHAAKGLEWPVVFVPNLSAPKNHGGADLCFDTGIGVGFKVTMQHPDGSYSVENPAIRKMIAAKKRSDEAAESARVLYVALTRARDRLYLTSAGKEGNDFAAILPGLEDAGIAIHRFDSAYELSYSSPSPATSSSLTKWIKQLEPVSPQFDVVSVTGLVEYSICPKRFKYQYVDGHPGVGTGDSYGARLIGTLTHTALELGKETVDGLAPFADGASAETLDEAVRLARVFRETEDFSSFHLGKFERELPVRIELNGKVLAGKADLVGDDYVLDFKTDSEMLPADHAIQLWAYAHALNKPRAYIAYLRQQKLYEYTREELDVAAGRAIEAMSGIASAKFISTPSEQACSRCAYCVICDERHKN